MSRMDALELIDRDIRKLWPKWEPNEFEVAAWADQLEKFPKECLKGAVRGHYFHLNAGYMGDSLLFGPRALAGRERDREGG